MILSSSYLFIYFLFYLFHFFILFIFILFYFIILYLATLRAEQTAVNTGKLQHKMLTLGSFMIVSRAYYIDNEKISVENLSFCHIRYLPPMWKTFKNNITLMLLFS